MSGNYKSGRPFRGYSSKAVSAILAGAIALSGASAVNADGAAAVAATTSTTPAATTTAVASAFSDVKSGFWAEKHIYKLAAQGIVIGNNGNFRPSDPVTQQEAVLMALRFMKLQNMVDKDAQVALPTDFKVSNYYKPYVVLAFQQKLLDKTLEMAPDNLKTSWGERKATREWIAEVLIRALGKSADAVAASTEPTGFADDAKVSSSKRGYINAAVDLGLANGLDGNRFDPQGAVTRAQLATFLSRAQAHNTLVYDNTATGTVSEIKDDKITIYDNGKLSTFNLVSSTVYFSSASEIKGSLNDIKPYTKVMVIGTNSNAAYVEVIDPKQQVESIQGSFAMITGNNKLFMKTADGYPEYIIDAATSFLDVNGVKIEPSSIAPDSLIKLLRETYTSTRKVVSVQVTSGVINKNGTGTLKAIDLNGKSITFKNAAGVEETFKWNDTTIFRYQNSILTAAELKVGSAVKYTISNNLIQSVEVTESVERTLQGTLYELSSSSVVYKKSDGTKEVKLLAAAPVIVIPGITNPLASDLIADAIGGDNIRLTLNSSDQVTKIEVTSRQIELFASLTVVSYNVKNKLLTALDSSNKPHLFTLDEKTKLTNEGTVPTLANIGNFLTEGRKVAVSAIGQRTFSLEVVTKYEGTVTSINTTTQKIEVKTNEGQTITLPFPISVDIFGRTNATIADVAVGNTVSAVLAGNQEVISVLRVKAIQQVMVTFLDTTSNRMNVKWAGGTSNIYTSGAVLNNEAGETLKLTDFKVGDYVNLVSIGSSPVSLQLVKLTTGQVLSLDTTGGTLTVKNFAGTTQSFLSGNNVKIIRASGTSTSLSSLAVSERVELRKDADGSTIIRVLPMLSRYFSRYESSSNQVVVKRDSINDENYRFQLASNAYIHQGDTTLTVQSLKENDNITVYFNNDVIIEIVKQ
ncbi:S-layer homology domain-containing protein [Paenibacillus wynnii]|uniref:S-layer homology domain-containing protein n=1 Tax=Paenibacillus wynnii TaxID=268407 RepID=UPI0027D80064|nr:S-layer homology domain-containing protein [Paenibacillus wynnii]